jgi:cell division protease FtsH
MPDSPAVPAPVARARWRARLDETLRTRAATRTRGAHRLTAALLAGLVLLLAVVVVLLRYLAPDPVGSRVGIADVLALAKEGRVVSVVLLDEDSLLVGQAEPGTGVLAQGGRFSATLPSDGSLTVSLTAALSATGAQVRVDDQDGKKRTRLLLTTLVPVLVLADLFALLLTAGRGSQSAIGGVVSFGTLSDGRSGDSAATFADVGGADEAVAELAEVRDYLKDPAKYRRLGAAPPKGVLLFGPPGTGKTLLARAVAGEAGVPFFSVAGAQFVESLVGVGAARVRDLFTRVRAVAPAILFIDELDAVGRRRGAGGSAGGSDEREQTLNQLLVEMDGSDVAQGIVVIAATNRPDILDPALMRPGRFDRHVTVERPDAEGRERILAIHAAGKPNTPDVDLARIAARTPGFTGADLANVVNEAALLAIRSSRSQIGPAEYDEAVQRVLSGPRRRGRVMTEAERRRVALHESGHAVVGAALSGIDDVHRVSVLARGRTVAATSLTSEEGVRPTAALQHRLATLLAGVAAERLVLGEVSTGGEGDLEEATELARDMVARYGMSDALGPVRLLASSTQGFLGDAPPIADLAPGTREALDAEVRRLLVEADAAAAEILARHRAVVDALVARLLVEEHVEGAELGEILDPVVNPPARRPAARRTRKG